MPAHRDTLPVRADSERTMEHRVRNIDEKKSVTIYATLEWLEKVKINP